MTTLDQALIKAFGQQTPLPPAVAPQSVGAAKESYREQRTLKSGRGEVGNERVSEFQPKASPLPPTVSVAAPCNSESAKASLNAMDGLSAATFSAPAISDRLPKASRSEQGMSVATPDGVWAALDKYTSMPVDRLRTEGGDSGEWRVESGDSGEWRVESGECTATIPAPESRVPNPEPRTPPTNLQPLKPAWRVDHFTWPGICRRLMARAPEQLDRLTDALASAGAEGRKVLVVGGCRRGEGATTLLLCAAHRLAERGVKTALVDADLARPRLARRLGVEPQLGWDETKASDENAIGQALVEAAATRMAILPAREPASKTEQPAGEASRLAACLGVLREHYDMVLVDLGPLVDAGLTEGAASRVAAAMIDGVILVHNGRVTSEGHMAAVAEQLSAMGIAVSGIVENFAAEE